MQCDIDSLPRRSGVLAEKATKWIKGGGRICIQQGIAQPGLADFANGQILSFIAGITETHFPITCLEIVGELSHLTAQTDVEQLVPVSEFFMSWTRVVKAAEPNSSGQWNRRSVNNQSCVPDCEGIKRILDWHTDAERTAGSYGSKISSRRVEWIGRKRHSGQRCIEIRSRILKVGKYRQVLIAQVARE